MKWRGSFVDRYLDLALAVVILFMVGVIAIGAMYLLAVWWQAH